MKYIPISILTLKIALLFSIAAYGQGLLKNTSISGSIGLSTPDSRMASPTLLKLKYNQVDREFGIAIQKACLSYKSLQVTAGIGYSQFITNFPRLIDHQQLTGVGTEEARVIKVYRINQMVFPVGLNLYLNSKKNIFINALFRPSFAMSKSVRDRVFTNKLYKWHPEFRGLDILPGVGVRFSQYWWLTLSYRCYYLNKLDTLLFYPSVFPEKNPEFLAKKYHTYNPFQMQITVGYVIKK